MPNPSFDSAASYDALVQTYLGVLERIADGWLMSGADYFAVMAGSRPLFVSPSSVMPDGRGLTMPLPSPEFSGISLQAQIGNTPAEQARLRGDALLIVQLLTLENELSTMTQELITLQDQQLALYDLNRALDQCVELRASLAVIARMSQRLTGSADAVAVLQINGHFVVEHTGRELSPALLEMAFATNQQAARSAQPMLMDGGYMLCVPMQVGKRTPGVLISLRPNEYRSPDIKLARAVAEQGRTHLHNVMLHEEQVVQARLQTEIELARSVQTRLLPRRLFPEPGVDIFGASRAALHVGGDFFDFILKPKISPLLVIGDVAGKGLSAALVMTMTRTAMRSAISATGQSPGALLRQVNDDLYDDFSELGLFTTAFAAYYVPESGEFVYANAGHSPVVYYAPGERARMIEADDTALGVLPFGAFEDRSLILPRGAVVVAATDGLVEAEDYTGTRFGYERFLEEIECHAHLSAEQLTEYLFSMVGTFRGDAPQGDDQTMIVLKRTD